MWRLLQACAAYSFITIPSLQSVYSQLQLYLVSGQVALLNQCFSQGQDWALAYFMHFTQVVMLCFHSDYLTVKAPCPLLHCDGALTLFSVNVVTVYGNRLCWASVVCFVFFVFWGEGDQGILFHILANWAININTPVWSFPHDHFSRIDSFLSKGGFFETGRQWRNIG